MEKRSTISRPKSSQTIPYTDFNSEVHPSRFHPGTRRTESSQQAVMPAMMTQVRVSVRKPAKPGIALSSVWNGLAMQRAVAGLYCDRLRCANPPWRRTSHLGNSTRRPEWNPEGKLSSVGVSLSAWFREVNQEVAI